jgi:hypothetical protein
LAEDKAVSLKKAWQLEDQKADFDLPNIISRLWVGSGCRLK